MEGLNDGEIHPEILIKGNISDSEKFAFYSYSIFAAILCLTFFVLVYITYKVIRKVGTSDKVIPLMLFFLQLSALSTMAFFIYDCRVLRLDAEFNSNACSSTILPTLSNIFLSIAVLLNVNKWIYFTMRIQSRINIR